MGDASEPAALSQTGKKLDDAADKSHPCRGKYFSRRASQLRAMMLDAKNDPSKTIMLPCSYDALTSKMVQDAGFPAVFVSGYPVAASLGLPDAGYVAFLEMAQKIQEIYRQVDVPILVDGDTGYGGPMNVKRAVKGFAMAGAAGVMIEDQTWPKRCGHAGGKAVVAEDEAYARMQAAVDAREEGIDIWILARTDSLYLGYDEALKRARKFIEIGADAVFVEALPDYETMQRFAKDIDFPCMANIIPGGRTETVSGESLANLGYAAVAYPFTLLGAQIQASRRVLKELQLSFKTGDVPRDLLANDVFEAVGFPEYYAEEEKYAYSAKPTGKAGHQWA